MPSDLICHYFTGSSGARGREILSSTDRCRGRIGFAGRVTKKPKNRLSYRIFVMMTYSTEARNELDGHDSEEENPTRSRSCGGKPVRSDRNAICACRPSYYGRTSSASPTDECCSACRQRTLLVYWSEDIILLYLL